MARWIVVGSHACEHCNGTGVSWFWIKDLQWRSKKDLPKCDYCGGEGKKETGYWDARREAYEETGLTITDPEYLGSFKISDWRYGNEVDGIKTCLFIAKKQFGAEKANDDIDEVQWFNVNNFIKYMYKMDTYGEVPFTDQDFIKSLIVPNHIELVECLIERVINDKSNISY